MTLYNNWYDWLQIQFLFLQNNIFFHWQILLGKLLMWRRNVLYCTELLLQFSFCSDLTLPNVTLFWNCNQEMVFDYITRGWTQLNNISTFVNIKYKNLLSKCYPESMIVYAVWYISVLWAGGRLGTPSIVTRSSLCQIGHKLPRLSPPSEEVSTLRLVISH